MQFAWAWLPDDTLILPKWIEAAQKRSLPRARRPLIAADIARFGLPSPDRADTAAMLFSGRAQAAPIDLESHAGESITGDLMTKAW